MLLILSCANNDMTFWTIEYYLLGSGIHYLKDNFMHTLTGNLFKAYI